jgi:hypothetical protein
MTFGMARHARRWAVAAAALACCHPSAAQPIPPQIDSRLIRTTAVGLTIRPDEVVARYELRNTTNQPVSSRIALPPVDSAVRLAFTFDGRQPPARPLVGAFVTAEDGELRDVSAKLNRYGVPLDPNDARMDLVLARLARTAIADINRDGPAIAAGDGVERGMNEIRWRSLTVHSWTQQFFAQRAAVLEIRFHPGGAEETAPRAVALASFEDGACRVGPVWSEQRDAAPDGELRVLAVRLGALIGGPERLIETLRIAAEAGGDWLAVGGCQGQTTQTGPRSWATTTFVQEAPAETVVRFLGRPVARMAGEAAASWPDASARLLSDLELRRLALAGMRRVYEDILARNNFAFADAALRARYAGAGYRPEHRDVSDRLSDVERGNIDRMRARLRDRGHPGAVIEQNFRVR